LDRAGGDEGTNAVASFGEVRRFYVERLISAREAEEAGDEEGVMVMEWRGQWVWKFGQLLAPRAHPRRKI
jgi:hypothetical protein